MSSTKKPGTGDEKESSVPSVLSGSPVVKPLKVQPPPVLKPPSLVTPTSADVTDVSDDWDGEIFDFPEAEHSPSVVDESSVEKIHVDGADMKQQYFPENTPSDPIISADMSEITLDQKNSGMVKKKSFLSSTFLIITLLVVLLGVVTYGITYMISGMLPN